MNPIELDMCGVKCWAVKEGRGYRVVAFVSNDTGKVVRV